MWLVALRRADIGPDLAKLRHRVVCSDHFTDDAYMCPTERHTTSRLNWDAVPTLFSHKNAPKQTPKRKPPAARLPLPEKKLDASLLEIPAHEEIANAPKKSTKVPKSSLKRLQQRLERKMEQNRQLKRKLAETESTLRRTIRNAKNSPLEGFQLGKQQRVFLNLQLRSSGIRKVREYSASEKEYAIALYHKYVCHFLSSGVYILLHYFFYCLLGHHPHIVI